MAKRLLNYNSAPAAVLLTRELALTQLLDDVAEELWRCRQIKKIIASRQIFLVKLAQALLQPRIHFRIREICLLVIKPAPERIEDLRSVICCWQKRCDLLAKLLDAELIESNSENRKVVGQKLCFGEIKERGHQLAFGQITRCAEQNQHPSRARLSQRT